MRQVLNFSIWKDIGKMTSKMIFFDGKVDLTLILYKVLLGGSFWGGTSGVHQLSGSPTSTTIFCLCFQSIIWSLGAWGIWSIRDKCIRMWFFSCKDIRSENGNYWGKEEMDQTTRLNRVTTLHPMLNKTMKTNDVL